MHKRTLTIATAALLISAQLAVAQGTCNAVAVNALNAVNLNCGGQANNTACYGNFNLQSQLAPGAAATFANPADRAPLESLTSITSQPFNAATQEWGVAVLKAQAGGPGVLPGQALTLLLVGDATLSGVGTQAYTITAGVGVPNCQGVPPSSLLIQGPQNIAVDLTINGAQIRLGSTMVISAREENHLTFATLDGRANIDGHLIPIGYHTTAELDEDGAIIGDSFTEPEIISEDEADLYAGFDEFPEEILEYEVYTPTAEELDLIEALGYEFASQVDGHLLADLVFFLVDAGYTPEEFAGMSSDDLVDFFNSDDFYDFAAETDPGLVDAITASYDDPDDELTLDDFTSADESFAEDASTDGTNEEGGDTGGDASDGDEGGSDSGDHSGGDTGGDSGGDVGDGG